MAGVALVEQYRDIKLSPRTRMALLMHATGVVKTKTEAARVAGVSKEYFTSLSNHSEEAKRLQNDVQSMLLDDSVSTSKIMQKIGRKALSRLDALMDSNNEGIALRAAQDLADRAPETQKTQKVAIDMLTISGQDAKALAAAMIESARDSARFDHVTREGLVEVDNEAVSESHTLKLVRGDYNGKEAEAIGSGQASDDA